MSNHVNADLRPFVDLLPVVDFENNALDDIRANTAMGALEAPSGDGFDVALTIETAPGPNGNPSVQVLVYRPTGQRQPLPAIFHIHGGGYVMGSPMIMDTTNRQLSAELSCVVVSVVYRLAPETAFPGSIEDCYAALTWLFTNATALGIDATRVGIKGESAGGGLAAALALMTRDRGEFSPIFQNLKAPMLDDRTCLRADISPYIGEFLWTPDQNRFGWTALLGHAPGIEGVSAYAAPARAVELAGLPPTFISVGSIDLFLEENLEYARRLAVAGVPVEIHVYPGGFHGFDMIPGAAIGAEAARASQENMRKAFAMSSAA
jgi:acetyl esterase/lipase